MRKSIKVHPKKRRGRPATGKDPLISARLPQELIDHVEAWATANSASRSEAIRRLLELGLAGIAKPRAKPSEKNAAKAKELAAKTIERLVDPAAPAEERVSRKHRLLKGLEEFREVRVDRVNKKFTGL
jgi:Arc/MetJ-type ribon-helix-helix transcriptional regulator